MRYDFGFEVAPHHAFTAPYRESVLEYSNQPAQTPQAVPVLHLSGFRLGRFGAPITVAPSGFESFFCDPLPYPQVSFTIRGRVLMQQSGGRRLFAPSDWKTLGPLNVVNRVYTGRGVSNSTSWVGAVKPDGTFATQSVLVVDPGTRRIRVQVTLETRTGKQVSTEVLIQYSPLECFLTLMDSWEDRMPLAGTATCNGAATHIEFLAAARKMFQPPPAPGGKTPDPSWEAAFNAFLARNAQICPLTALDSVDGRNIRRYENIEIGGANVDMGHVLTGIEGSRRQKPASVLPPVRSAAGTEAFVTWAGDLGSALEQYAETAVSGARGDLKYYLGQKAGAEDLLGHIDGINIGAVYDENKSLAENLRDYYRATPFRRFHNFLGNARNDDGTALFRLARSTPPLLDRTGRLPISAKIAIFARGLAFKHNVASRLPQPKATRLTDMLQEGPTKAGPASAEMEAVVEYFLSFLENGLARESGT